jgi:predicted DCC family thiol-disulfide oxidoreductase YuxK
MVKRFFESAFRFSLILIVGVAALWGMAQAFVDLPYGKDINKWLLLSFSIIMTWHVKDFMYDLFFWGREMKKCYNGQE